MNKDVNRKYKSSMEIIYEVDSREEEDEDDEEEKNKKSFEKTYKKKKYKDSNLSFQSFFSDQCLYEFKEKFHLEIANEYLSKKT
jgi:hypothetical protein